MAKLTALEKKQLANERSRLWYKNNKTRRDALVRKVNKERKLWAIDLLGGKCQDCQGVFPAPCYDFHHVNGEKDMNPSEALKLSKKRGEEELRKCVLLCSNCHRIRHFPC